MRKIKFRVWNEPIRIYAYTDDGLKLVFPDIMTNKQVIVEQYTGLKDKNGKSIYEGDIIKYYGSNKRVKVKTTYGIVFYDSEHGCFNSRIQNGEHNKGGINPGDDLVVGNIHENADLLEVPE